MNLRTYIDLYQLLDQDSPTHESSRTFALEKNLEGESAYKRLSVWASEGIKKLSGVRLSDTVCGHLYHVTLLLGILVLVAGFFSGIALLHYSGREPVNVIYFSVVAVGIPLLTMLLGLLSMLRASRTQSLLVHISPAYWMEKILGFLPGRTQAQLTELKINPLLLNWLVIKRARLLALLFAIGLLLALLGVVTTKDVAFAWSTTLQVSAEQFHAILETLAWPWRGWLPSAVPSLELIEKSQYFRLGGKLDSEMVTHAGLLGEWWKFLASATLFYAVVLRALLWMFANKGFHHAVKRSLLSLEGSERLLYQMKTPIVSTAASEAEHTFVQRQGRYARIAAHSKMHYATILGWAMSEEMLVLLNDSLGIGAPQCFDVGGTKTLEEDSEVLTKIDQDVLLYVKAWEPPTMDIVDFIEALGNSATHITVCPVGTAAQGYQAVFKTVDIWERKLLVLDHPKVWLWRNN